MKLLLKFKRKIIQQIVFILPLICLITLNSCKESTNTSDSDLIIKVNAVQKQMMVQGNISEEERQAILGLAKLVANEEDFSDSRDLVDVIEFNVVENGPVYPGCEGFSPEESKQCFIESVNKLIDSQFNFDIVNSLEVTEPKSVEVFFKINKNGKMSNLKVRDANVIIQAEVLRVIKLLPIMKPGFENGAEVDVMCSTVISYIRE